jgi:hypothetical protein
MKMQHDEIRLLIINPLTQQPITRKTLVKFFARELSAGTAMLKELVTAKYYEALSRGESWAIRTRLKNRLGWAIGFDGVAPAAVMLAAPDAGNITVTFVCPSRKEPESLDLTPPADPYAGQPADLSRPALPSPPGRRRGPLGWIEERPTKDGGTGMSEAHPEIRQIGNIGSDPPRFVLRQ